MGEYTPTHIPGHDKTYTATAAVTGGQVIEVSATGESGAPTSAASNHTVGLALYDAAIGARFAVCSGGYQTPLSGAAITAGVPVKSGAAGTVVPWVSGTDGAELIVAKAILTVASAGLPVLVKWVA